MDKIWVISLMLSQSNNNICTLKNKKIKLSENPINASRLTDNNERMKVQPATTYR